MTQTITVLTGTARRDNVSQHIASAVVAVLEAAGGTVTATNVAAHLKNAVTVPPWGEGGADTVPTPWKELVASTDIFVFVLPEYNHSFPGEWKILMDSLYGEYAGKKAYVVAVGGGQFAGARVMEHVMPVLVNFKFVIGNERLHVGHASTAFDTEGNIADEKLKERMQTFATSVISG